MLRGSRLLWLASIAWILTAAAAFEAPLVAGDRQAADRPPEGIPITDPTVRKACGACHAADDKQQMSRISFRRTTPEGWQETIRRMVALNGVRLDPQTAREVVRYLSNHLGLAPEEAAAAAWETERRLVDYKYAGDADTEQTCIACHSFGRILHQRRTRQEWELLVAMHRGWYPLVDFQSFRRTGPPPPDPGPDGRPADKRHPMEKAIDHLSRTFPLHTAEWAAWSASMRPPRLEGEWALSGWEPGRGPIAGRVTIAAVAGAPDEFTTTIRWTYARGGQTVARAGRAVVYTGFQWRGRSTEGSNEQTSLREVMSVDRGWQSMSGRWFTGGYDELGVDVTLTRIGRETVVTTLSRTALRRGAPGQEITFYGANLPTAADARALDLGPGVTVSRVVHAAADALTVLVDVAADAAIGPRDVFLAGAARPAALTVYDQVQHIRVTPAWNMARVGGVVFPKMLARFEAWGYHNGPDGQPDTPDDLKLDTVPATWSLEEYTATYADDDLAFVGVIDPATGVFTPNVDGPNPKRSGERNNVGDVWAVASYTPEGSTTALRARAHLLVTVPLYMRWEAPASR
ncbi:MAG: quinohemoprotein amine dehydrogenase subunit alpha [Acidobacteriota bacterium]